MASEKNIEWAHYTSPKREEIHQKGINKNASDFLRHNNEADKRKPSDGWDSLKDRNDKTYIKIFSEHYFVKKPLDIMRASSYRLEIDRNNSF